MEDRTYRIGLLIHDTSSEYSKELIQAITDACYQCNTTVFVFIVGELGVSYGRYDYQRRSVTPFISTNNLDALICASATQGNRVSIDELTKYLKSFSPLPVVSIGVDIPGIPSVVVNCDTGLRKLIEHLINKHDCKRIALMGVRTSSPEAAERTRVYKDTLNQNGIEFDSSIVMYGAFTYASAKSALSNYAKKCSVIDDSGSKKKLNLGFDAIVCLNDDMAFGIIDFCNENGIRVPEDLIVTGFDDVERSSYSKPTLTSVSQQMGEQGRFALSVAIDLINKKEVQHVSQVASKAFLRQSCGCIDLNNHSINSLTIDGSEQIYRNEQKTSSIAEWLSKRTQLSRIINYNADTQAALEMDAFRHRLNTDFGQFAITGAAVCMFEEPIMVTKPFTYFHLPQKAMLLSSFDILSNRNADVSKPPEVFDPTETITPPETLTHVPGKVYVSSLYHCEMQYGYIIYRPGDFDDMLYDMMCTILSSALASSYAYTKTQSEKKILADNNQKLNNLSRTDEMTSLLNRRGFMHLGQQSIHIALTMQQKGLVVFGDMDNLKGINDKYGHNAGDIAIKAEASILRSVFRASDVIGRLGGDEFAVVAVGLDVKILNRITTKLDKECAQWNETTKEPFTLSISLGFAPFNNDEYELGVLLQKADAMQYEEKKRKRAGRL